MAIYRQSLRVWGARCPKLFAVDKFFTEKGEVLLIDARAEPT